MFGRGEVVRIDTATNAVKARIRVGGNPEDVVLAAGAAWVPNENGTVARIDPATNMVTKTIQVGPDPDNAVFCRGRLWVSSLRGPRLYVVDPGRTAFASRMRVGTGSVGLGCGRSLWAANYNVGSSLKIDMRRRRVVRRVSVGSEPREVVLAAGSVWVSNQGSGTVSRIRP